MENPIVLDTAVVLTAALLFVWLRGKKSSAAPLPPGPKKLPLLGNLLDMPTEREWVKFTAWGNQFGMFSHIPVCRLLTSPCRKFGLGIGVWTELHNCQLSQDCRRNA